MKSLFPLVIGILCLPPVDIRAAAETSSNRVEIARRKRYLVYPPPGDFAPTKVQLIIGLGLPMEVDVSMIIGYVMKFNYVLPYNASYLTDPYVRFDRSIAGDVEHGSAIPNASPRAVVSRWELYDILVSSLGSSYSAKACLLRMICEAADVPINRAHGLCPEILHLILTPSSTSEPVRTAFDGEYHAAEVAGREDPSLCEDLFPECPESLLEYFSETVE